MFFKCVDAFYIRVDVVCRRANAMCCICTLICVIFVFGCFLYVLVCFLCIVVCVCVYLCLYMFHLTLSYTNSLYAHRSYQALTYFQLVPGGNVSPLSIKMTTTMVVANMM